MRCRACNAEIKAELKDPITKEYSDLCGKCLEVSQYVVEGVFTEPEDYAFKGTLYEGTKKASQGG